MSESIDKKIVEMQFDNKQFESNVKTSVNTLDNLKRSLDFKNASKSFGDLSSIAKGINFGHIADGVSTISSRFTALGIIAITTLQNITNQAIATGERMVKALTLDPIMQGFSEYETLMGSIQTVLANTQSKGTTLVDVNKALQQLNEYSDKTIYNFQQMARNIGTFTAAGVGLNESVLAIKGIANLAAVSGSSADQASTAMYQLSQALASGTVKLMDWNSVVNAGMGGEVFQNALKETARVHGIAIDDIIKKEGSFRESLSTGWLSKEILIETLSKFTGDMTAEQLKAIGYTDQQIAGILKLGKTAQDAATKVKTFSQLWDTLKEAVQSGWALSWQLVIGDFEEAKSWLTSINDTLSKIVGESADARNNLLQGWKDLGGRTEMIQSLQNIFDAVSGAAKVLGDALKEIFPPVTSKNLYDLTVGIKNFTENLKMAAPVADKVKSVFKGIFSILDIGRMLFVALAKAIFGINLPLGTAAGGLLTFLANIGNYLTSLRNSIKETDTFGKMFKSIGGFIAPVIGFITTIANKIKYLFAMLNLANTFKGGKQFGESIKGFFEPLGKVGQVIGKFIGAIGLFVQKISPILSKLKDMAVNGFGVFLDSVTLALEKFDPAKAVAVINGGLFAAILLGIRKFISRGENTFKGITDILDGVKGSLEAWQNSLKAGTLLKIAEAIGILALSLLVISFIDGKKLAASLGAITLMFIELFAAMDIMGKGKGGVSMNTMALSLIGIAAAMLILSGAVAILGNMDTGQLIKGTLAMAGLIFTLTQVSEVLSKNSAKIASGSAGLITFGLAMLVFSLAIKSLGSIKPEIIVTGLLAMAGSLAVIAIAMNSMPSNMAQTAVQLLIVSGAILLLSVGLKQLGGMSWEQIAKGLVALSGSLVILAIGLDAMTGSIAGSLSLLVAAGAIAILAPALAVLGSIPLESIGIALLALAGVFVILGLAGAILTPVIPSLLGLGATMLLIGIAAFAVGAGVSAFAAGLALLATAGAAGAAALMLVMTTILSILPMMGVQLAKAFLGFIETMISGAPIVLKGAIALLSNIIEAIVIVTPKIVDAVFVLIDTLLASLASKLPNFIQSGFDILMAFLNGIKNNIERIVTVAFDIVTKFLNALASKIPAFVDSGYKLLIAFINGLTDAVDKNIPMVMEAATKLGIALVKGALKGIVLSSEELLDEIKKLALKVLESFKKALGISSPSKEFAELGLYTVQGFVNGINRNSRLVKSASDNLVRTAISGFDKLSAQLLDSVNSSIDTNPVIRPVIDLTDIEKNKSTLDKLIGDRTFNLSAVNSKVTGISKSVNTPELVTTIPSTAKQTTVSFTQNNYSPKELSRIDIYRQTNNQLLKLRGLVGNA